MLVNRTQIIECNQSHQMGDVKFRFLGIIDLFKFDEVGIFGIADH